MRLAPEPAAPVEKEEESMQAKEKERRLDAGNRHLDHCACAREPEPYTRPPAER